MKKLNIYSILLISFSLVATIVFISGIREIIVLNYLKEQKTITKNNLDREFLLNKLLILIESEHQILQSIFNINQQEELKTLVSKHEGNISVIETNFRKLISDFTENLKKEEDSELEEINKLIVDVRNKYKGTYLLNYKKVIEQQYKLINIDIYYIEKLGSNNSLLKIDLLKNLQSELSELKKRQNQTLETISSKVLLSQNKNNLLSEKHESKLNESYRKAQNTAFLFFISIIIILIVVLMYLLKLIPGSINKIQKQLQTITEGELPNDLEIKTGGEFQKITKTINKLVEGLKRLVNFSLEIGKRKFDTEYKLSGKNDVLGSSLLSLRDNLQAAQKDEEARKAEDAQRNRTNEGLTLFSEILRQQSGSITELADVIISNLVKFMKANQGGLFFLNEEDKDNIHYELLGAYAYNRKKFLSKQVIPGEGLVGAVAIEKYTVYMTDVPDEYVEIESGVGSANPNSILIVPLKKEENVLGVIELASFNKIEKYEIEMVEKIAESIASSLENARINMQTSTLLERSKDQERLVLEQEQEITQYIKEIKELTKENNKLSKELEMISEKKE